MSLYLPRGEYIDFGVAGVGVTLSCLQISCEPVVDSYQIFMDI